MDQRQRDRGDRAAGDCAQPVGADRAGRQQVGVAGAERAALGQRLRQRVARELGVALPAQAVAAEPQVHEIAGQRLRSQRLLARQATQVRGLGVAADAGVEDDDLHDQRRQPDARRRAGVHLVVQAHAQRVVGRQPALRLRRAGGGGGHWRRRVRHRWALCRAGCARPADPGAASTYRFGYHAGLPPGGSVAARRRPHP